MKQTSKRNSSETISEEARLREIDERHFLAQQIFFRREARQWSQEELARVSGLTQAQVATLEAGQGNPTLRTLTKLAEAFSCGVQDLFQDSGVPADTEKTARYPRAPLDVEGIDAGITTDEMVAFAREGRDRFDSLERGGLNAQTVVAPDEQIGAGAVAEIATHLPKISKAFSTAFGCEPGDLAVTLSSDPSDFPVIIGVDASDSDPQRISAARASGARSRFYQALSEILPSHLLDVVGFEFKFPR